MVAVSKVALKDYLFISYAHDDYVFVEQFVANLKDESFIIWIDSEGLQPGTRNWEDSIREAISGAIAVLLIASPSSRQSTYVQDELAIARMYQRPIFPIWAQGDEWIDSITMGMGKTQYIDARSAENYERGLRKLASALRELKGVEGNGKPAAVVPPVTRHEPPPAHPKIAQPRNPYKGLRAFREDEQEDFFGRERFLEELFQTLSTNSRERMLPIIGPSGSGKSSLVIAGLLPGLRRGQLPGSERWYYLPTIVPGTHPVEKLIISLKTALKDSFSDIQQDLENPNARGLHLRACQIVAEQDCQRVVLYIDQFEELFTQLDADNAEHEAEREQFINLLVAAVSEHSGPVIVVLSMRADFYDRPMNYPELGKLMEKYGRSVLPLSVAELYDVVQKPASLPDVQLTYEEGLQAELVFEIRDQLGGLPLLQFTLDQLFNHRTGQLLTLEAYRNIGGVRGALARHAEATYEALGAEEHKSLARGLFLRLIEPGMSELDTTRRRASLDEFQLSTPQDTAAMQQVIDTFVNARLLVTDQGTSSMTVEVSHEALIREWKRLNGWLDEARDDIQLQQEVSADVREWVNREYPPDRLYRGSQLHDALEWARRSTPSQKEMEFLDESRKVQERFERSQRLRTYAMLAAVIAVLVVIVSALVIINQKTQENLDEIQDTQAQAFPLLADSYLADGKIPQALDTALKALEFREKYHYPRAQIALVNAMSQVFSGQPSAFAIQTAISGMTWSNTHDVILTTRNPPSDCRSDCKYKVELRDREGKVVADWSDYPGSVSTTWIPVNETWNKQGTHFLVISSPASSSNCQKEDCIYKVELGDSQAMTLEELAHFDTTFNYFLDPKSEHIVISAGVKCDELCAWRGVWVDFASGDHEDFNLELSEGYQALYKRTFYVGSSNITWQGDGFVLHAPIDSYYYVDYYFVVGQQSPILVRENSDLNKSIVMSQWSPDYKYFVVYTQKDSKCNEIICPTTMDLWDSQGKHIAASMEHTDTSGFFIWGKDNAWFAASANPPKEADCQIQSCEYEVRVWDTQGQLIGEPQNYSNNVLIYTFAHYDYDDNESVVDGFYSLSNAAEDCTADCVYEVRIWDQDGHFVAGPLLQDFPVRSLIWNDDQFEYAILSGSSSKSDCKKEECSSLVTLYDQDGRLLVRLSRFSGSSLSAFWNKDGSVFTTVSLSPDNSDCAEDPCQYDMQFWDAAGNHLLGPLPYMGQLYSYSNAVWNPAGTLLATIANQADDHDCDIQTCQYQAQIWDTQGQPLTSPVFFDEPVNLSWNVEGDRLVAVTRAGKCQNETCQIEMRLWDFSEPGSQLVDSQVYHDSFVAEIGNVVASAYTAWSPGDDLMVVTITFGDELGVKSQAMIYLMGMDKGTLVPINRQLSKSSYIRGYWSEEKATNRYIGTHTVGQCIGFSATCITQYRMIDMDDTGQILHFIPNDQIVNVFDSTRDDGFIYTRTNLGTIKIWQKDKARYQAFDSALWRDGINTLIWDVNKENYAELMMVEGDPVTILEVGSLSGQSIAWNDLENRRYLLLDSAYQSVVYDAVTGNKIISVGHGYSYSTSTSTSASNWTLDGTAIILFSANNELQRIPVDLETLFAMGTAHCELIRCLETNVEETPEATAEP